MTSLHVDFETRSAVDLKKTGAYVYAQDPSTDVWCMAYAFDDGEVELWTPGQPIPPAVKQHVESGGTMLAHNAAFERVIWRYVMTPRYGWPEPALDQWRCTMVMAFAMALPGSLEHMSATLGSEVQKDMSGRRLMLAMSKPRWKRKGEPDGVSWRDDPEDLAKLYDYCRTDVAAERTSDKRLIRLRPSEQDLWHLDQTINDRGVFVDVDLAQRALALVEHQEARLDKEMARVTDWEVTACTNLNQLKVWLKNRGIQLGEKLDKKTMTYVDTLDKAFVDELLAKPDLDPVARQALEVRQEAGKASVAKINAILNGTSPDGRARGLLQFHAANTGRWAGRRFQPQNLKRPPEDFDCDAAIDVILRYPTQKAADVLDSMFDAPMSCLSYILRGLIRAAPGKKIVAADFSNIEGRVLAWLAGETKKVDAFRAFDAGKGPDLYLVAAAGIYGVPVASLNKKSPERQIGKVAELACFGPDTLVLTDKGYKPITAVLTDDLLWDGVEWVTHQGVISRGVRRIVRVAGTEVTPDHLILTGQKWRPASELASSENIFRQGLATGSANLPWMGLRPDPLAGFTVSSLFAHAARRLMSSHLAISGTEKRQPATRARNRKHAVGSKTIGGTQTLSRTMRRVAEYLTAFRRATTAATILTTPAMQITGRAAFTSTPRGEKIDERFWNISRRLTDGTSPSLSSTELMSTADTSRETFASSHGERTPATNAESETCSGVSLSWRPVFDILNAGPRNRLTIWTESGPLIAHNCGYQGGVGAFQTMAHGYGLKIPDTQADEIKTAWRDDNPNIVRFWYDLEEAGIRAIANPGKVIDCGPVKFKVSGSFLWLQLPSGRALCYPYPAIREIQTPWGALKEAITFKTVPNVSNVRKIVPDPTNTSRWSRISTYGGSIAENVTQAVARDLLGEAMVRLEAENYPLILTCHDENVSEPDEGFGSADEYEQIMSELPAWATGLPVAAAGFEDERYRK